MEDGDGTEQDSPFEEGDNSALDNELSRGIDVSPLNIGGDVPLSINCLTVKGSLVGTLRYDKGVLSDENAQALMKEFAAQLALL